MYRIMCNVYFPCQDGYDYMQHEADGKYYDSHEEAEKQRKDYMHKCPNNYGFIILKEDEQ